MSATNTTTNYNLPIFIETDKPAWLVDFNGAMRAIDVQMKTNADAIATKSPILTFNDTTEIDFTKSGDIITANLTSGVSDKVGRALVTPIAAPASEQLVAINTNGVQDALSLGTGFELDSGVLNVIDLNLSSTGSFTATNSVGTGTISGAINYAINSSNTIGKIYGVLGLSSASTGSHDIILSGMTPDISEAFDIYPAGICYWSGTSNTIAYLHFDADGKTHLIFNAATNSGTVLLFPSIYFFQNFGDTLTL